MPPGKKEVGALEAFDNDFPTAEQIQQQDTDFLNPAGNAQETVVADEVEEVKPPRENREVRRLRAKLQAEREVSIQLAGRLQGLTESQKFASDTTGTIDQRLLSLYGDDENGRRAAQITQSLLEDNRKAARADALKELQDARDTESAETKQNEDFIDEQFEELEDKYNVDLTSNSPNARKMRDEFIDLVEDLSPKDTDGNITDYIDFDKAFTVYQKTRERPNTQRQKDLASRGMVRSGTSTAKVENSAEVNYLKQIGII